MDFELAFLMEKGESHLLLFWLIPQRFAYRQLMYWVVVRSFNDSAITGAQRDSLLDAWRTLPGVASATAADIAPGLTSRHGVGPVSAAQAIVSFSHPGRCRSEAAYAALGGTSPIPASSGQAIRHRHGRGGDRALNRAIHAIAVVRMRSCPRTRAYVARRTAEGKTTREIRRCLKRYIARELYRHLTRSMNPPVGP